MSWEKRGNKRCFYRTERRKGRSVHTYYGSGEIADLAATAEALLRVQREVEDRRRKREQEPLAIAETHLYELCEQSDMLVRATLVAAGYHRDNRGVWRPTIGEIQARKSAWPSYRPKLTPESLCPWFRTMMIDTPVD